MPDPTPLEDLMVNERSWLAFGKKLVEAGVTRYDAAADKLVTTVTWFWTVYTATALIGAALTSRSLGWWRVALIAAPVVGLLIAYLLGVAALMPRIKKMDPRSPTQVERAHYQAMDEKHERLRWAWWAVLVSGVLVAIAAIVTVTAPQADEAGSLAASLNADGSSVLASGFFPKSTQVVLTVSLPPPNETSPGPATTEAFTTSSTGSLSAEVDVPTSAASYMVTASWTVDDVSHSTSVEVVGSQPSPSTTPS